MTSTVSVTEALLGRGLLREASRIVTVTKTGEAGLRDWPGVDLVQLRSAA